MRPLIYIIIIIAFFSCHKSPKCWGKKEYNGLNVEIFNPCSNCNLIVNSDSCFVINSSLEYEQLSNYAHSNQTICAMNEINFNQYTLLGKTIWGRCKFKVKRNLEIKNELKKYIYSIELSECGNCKEENKIDNWALVPKIPPGYSVEFRFIRK